MNDYFMLACVAIGGILVGWVACCLFSWPYLKEGDKVIKAQQKLLDEKDELIEDKRDMIQVLDERISLGNEHISALNDLLRTHLQTNADLTGELQSLQNAYDTVCYDKYGNLLNRLDAELVEANRETSKASARAVDAEMKLKAKEDEVNWLKEMNKGMTELYNQAQLSLALQSEDGQKVMGRLKAAEDMLAKLEGHLR